LIHVFIYEAKEADGFLRIYEPDFKDIVLSVGDVAPFSSSIVTAKTDA
jgi:hypothetical protein